MAMFGRTHLLTGGLSSLFVFLLPLHGMFPEDSWWLTVVILLYGVSLLRAAIDRHHVMVASLRLRDEKQALLEQQRIETQRANKANNEKSAFLAAASHDQPAPLSHDLAPAAVLASARARTFEPLWPEVANPLPPIPARQRNRGQAPPSLT